MDQILIRGARTHNLKNIDLTLPRDKLIVITGLSGSGKSSLAFDTLYAEGQRRYVESLSAYARQFLSMMEKPDVDTIEGLSPAISIEQKSTSHNPRSTVGTITEIHDYLRLLYARVGTPRCPEHDVPLEAQTVSQMVDQVLALPEGRRLMLLAPVVRERKGEHLALFEELRAQGFVRARVDGTLFELDELPRLDKQKKHSIEVVVDRFKVRGDLQQRLAESFETALKLADGIAWVAPMEGDDGEEIVFSARFACPHCGHAIGELEPKLFSFNDPAGACPSCDGLGVKQFFDPRRLVNGKLSLAEGAIRGWDRRNVYYFQMLAALAAHYGFDLEAPFEQLPAAAQRVLLHGSGREALEFRYLNDRGDIVRRSHTVRGHPAQPGTPLPRDRIEQRARGAGQAAQRPHACPDCRGARLRREARHVWVGDKTLPQVSALPVGEACAYFAELSLSGRRGEIAAKILKEIRERLQFLVNVGLDYLTLERSADTLSGGEAQRIRLASQIGAGLVGVMYILDEPSIGLHQRDNERLLATLTHLRDLGNTVIVVEHDEDAIRLADHVIDIGPGAGVHGGRIVAQGTPAEVMAHPDSLTGRYLSGRTQIRYPARRTPVDPQKLLRLKGARGNNLQSVDLELPVGLLTCVTGVSGSGKSTLINNTLYPLAATALNGAESLEAAPHERLEGLEHLDKVVDIDQSPIGRTPRSNPADLHRAVHPDPRTVRRGAGVALARLRPGALLLQRQGRTLRGLPGRRGDQGGDALPAGRLRAVRRVQGQALQPRDPGGEVQGQEHPRGAGDDHRGGPRILRRGAGGGAQAADPDRRGARLHQARPERHHPVRRRGAAGQAEPRAVQARHRQDPVHPRRADHRPALRRHPAAARRAAPSARPRQHRGGDRAQPRRDQDRRLAGRPRPRGRLARRTDHRQRVHPSRSASMAHSHTGRFLAPLLERCRG